MEISNGFTILLDNQFQIPKYFGSAVLSYKKTTDICIPYNANVNLRVWQGDGCSVQFIGC